jgi:hypothetical protein
LAHVDGGHEPNVTHYVSRVNKSAGRVAELLLSLARTNTRTIARKPQRSWPVAQGGNP